MSLQFDLGFFRIQSEILCHEPDDYAFFRLIFPLGLALDQSAKRSHDEIGIAVDKSFYATIS
jgi:hypothetical protein